MRDLSLNTKRNLILMLGVFGGATSCLFSRWADCPAVVLAFYRMLFSAALMIPYMLVRKRQELARVGRRELLLCLAAGVFLAIHFTSYFGAIRHTSIAAAQTLTNLEVFFVALLSFVLWRERISPAGWLGILVVFGGGLIIALADMGEGGNLSGDLMAIGAGLAMASYTLIGRRNRRHMSTACYTFVVYAAAAVTLTLLVPLCGHSYTGYGSLNWLCGLAMALLCTFGGHTVFSWSLKHFTASHVSTIKLLDPLFCTVLALLFFRELPGLITLLGCLVLIGGTVLYVRSGN